MEEKNQLKTENRNFNIYSFFKNSHKTRIIYLVILCFSSLSFRMYFFPEDLPFLGDAVGYFWYANDMSILGSFPEGYTTTTGVTPPPNNGWPVFLSLFFSLIDSNNFLDYVNMQRLLTLTISTVTILPIYLLTKKFLETPYALICATAFAFAPRLIENSLLGLTEPLFLLLAIISLNLFLSEKKILVIISFAIAGLFSIIRYEGLLVLIPLTIIFFLRFHKNRSDILKYSIAISLFLLIVVPIAMIRIETTGQDGLTSHLIHGPQYYVDTANESGSYNQFYHFLEKGGTFLIQHIAFVSIPIFFIFIPYGMLEIFRKKDFKKWTIIIFGIVFLIPAFYAYSRGFQDTRYILILYPIFCLTVGYTIRGINLKIQKSNIVFILTVIFLVLSSLIFTNYTITDYEYEKEMYSISKQIFEITDTINRDYEGLMYMKWTNEFVLSDEFPILQIEIKEKLGKSKTVILGKGTKNNFNNIDDYLSFAESEKMTHLVLDGRNLETKFLNEIFSNEEKFPYLVKIYDSHEKGFKKQVKVFKIDYKLMNENFR